MINRPTFNAFVALMGLAIGLGLAVDTSARGGGRSQAGTGTTQIGSTAAQRPAERDHRAEKRPVDRDHRACAPNCRGAPETKGVPLPGTGHYPKPYHNPTPPPAYHPPQ